MGVLKSLLFFFTLGLTGTLLAQDAELGKMKEQFAWYQQHTLQEKTYVHTDKSTYLAGEIVWLKVYLVDAAKGTPQGLSKVAYIDVLDKDNHFLAQAKLALNEGSGSGSLFLPLSVASGNYKLRGYTAWMKNFGSEHFFEKPITIINTLKNPEPRSTGDSAYAIRFFPEGGTLVTGLESTVAVQATAPTGSGQAFYATIVSEAGDSVAAVRSLQHGIGRFAFTPQAGHSYSAIVKLPSGRTVKKALPEADRDGYVMRMYKEGDSPQWIDVALSDGMTDRTLYLLVHNRKSLQQAVAQRVHNGRARFSIDATVLKDGITYFTICDEARKPVCERLYFKKPALASTLSLSSDKQEYGTRKRVNVTIQTDPSDTAARTELSLAVTKNDVLQDSNRADIFTHLWLTSELGSGVEVPAYYFSTDADVAEATENLMLTHGWRRFRWTQLASTPAFRFPPEVSGHLLRATIADRFGKPAPGINAYLSVPGNPFQLAAAQSDSTGVATFELKHHYGPGEIVLQTNTAYDSGCRMAIMPPFAQPDAGSVLPLFTFSNAHAEALLQHSIGMQVQRVYREDSLNQFTPPPLYDTLPFYGRTQYSYVLDAYTRFPTMEEVLREYVRPINVVQRRGAPHLLILDEPRQQFFEGGELVLLDGVPLFRKDQIFAYDPLKVKKLDVITRRYYLGANFFNGLASFSTYSGNYDGLQLDPNAVVIDYEGLQLHREFYAPVYETPQQIQSRVPDFRSTLLWQPRVTVQHGAAMVSFYTSDVKGSYSIDVQGIDANGTPIVARLSMDVK